MFSLKKELKLGQRGKINCYKDEKELAHHVFEKHENNGNSTGTDSELEMMTAGSQGKLFLSFGEFSFKFWALDLILNNKQFTLGNSNVWFVSFGQSID